MRAHEVSPVVKMRHLTNSLHVLHAIDVGVRMGFFETLAQIAPPVSVEVFVKKVNLPPHYIIPWLRAMQAAHIITIDDHKNIHYGDGWEEALTDRKRSCFMANLPRCHLEIARTYDQFPAIFRGEARLRPADLSKDLIRAISHDGIRFAHFFASEALRRVPHLRARLEGGAIVYDVGCGGGMMLLTMAEYFPASTFVGIDVLPTAIEVAREEATRMGIGDRVEFKLMNATELPEAAADVLIFNEVLHEIPPDERAEALKASRRALKPEGLLFVADALIPTDPSDYAQPGYLPAALCDFFEAPWGSKVATRAEFDELLSRAGFAAPEPLPFPDELFVAFVRSR